MKHMPGRFPSGHVPTHGTPCDGLFPSGELDRFNNTQDALGSLLTCVLGHGLQVATQRVKTAQKAEIPHIDEHVSKIEYVGVQTQAKLQDIKSAGASVGVYGLNVVHNCITTGLPCSFLPPTVM